MAIGAAIEQADPLGLRRCANCVYDRRGLPDGVACPECGYVLPQGVAVLNLPRVPETKAALFVPIVFASMLFAMIAYDPVGTLRTPDYATSTLACGLIATLVRALRMRLSGDSYIVQIWLSPVGSALEGDADRFAAGRGFERLATPVLDWTPFAIPLLPLFKLLRYGPVFLAIPLGVYSLIAAVWMAGRWNWRRSRAVPIDEVAPPLTRWGALHSLRISTRKQTTSVSITLRGVVMVSSSVAFAGGPFLEGRVRAAVDAARPRRATRSTSA
jgi:hypothetical protein